MADVVCGLDFGTSNSTLALIEDGKPFLVPVDQGRSTIPSAIFYNFEDDSVRFGQDAIDQYVQGTEGRLMRSLKSILGTALIGERTSLRKRSVYFTEVIADFVRHMKASSEAMYGVTLRDVVAGRPVHFVDDDAEADARAQREYADILRSVGFSTIEFQYEPIAAAFQYTSDGGASEGRGQGLAFIVDIGGGTSDFSIVKSAAGGANRDAEILATHGVHLGGTDIDRIVSLETIMPNLGLGSRIKGKNLPVPSWIYNDLATWHKINGLYTNQIRTMVREIELEAARPDLIRRLRAVLDQRMGHALLGIAESLKIELSESKSVSFPLNIAGDPLHLEATAVQLRLFLRAWLASIKKAMSETLKQGGVKANDIATVFLTGGTTLSPIVRAVVESAFPKAKIASGDNFGAVGLGLAIAAERRFNQ
jgi:hypothetical chaperone protein